MMPRTGNTKINKENASRMRARKKVLEIYPDLRRLQFVHHMDHNPLNNNINNLMIISARKHRIYHANRWREQRIKYIEKVADKLNAVESAYFTGQPCSAKEILLVSQSLSD